MSFVRHQPEADF